MSINIETIHEDLRALTSSEWEAILPVIQAEADRRYTIGSFEEQATELQAKYQAATGVLKGRGKEWEKPLGHNTYAIGDIVKYQGKFYKSVIPFNSWSPSEYPAGWEQVDEADLEPGAGEPQELDFPEWEAGVDYKTGDRVTHNGVAYEVIQPHTSAAHWLPADVPALYTRIS